MTTEERIRIIRHIYPQMIAQQLVDVQPMPKDLDWDALDKAFNSIRAYRRILCINCCDDPIQVK